jgi:hypothetical protein
MFSKWTEIFSDAKNWVLVSKYGEVFEGTFAYKTENSSICKAAIKRLSPEFQYM